MGIAFCVADIEHLIERDRGLVGRLQLLDLTKDLVDIMEAGCALGWTHGIQLFACLDDQQPNGDRPGSVRPMMPTNTECMVRPTTT